jgi:hypothetical protein
VACTRLYALRRAPASKEQRRAQAQIAQRQRQQQGFYIHERSPVRPGPQTSCSTFVLPSPTLLAQALMKKAFSSSVGLVPEHDQRALWSCSWLTFR